MPEINFIILPPGKSSSFYAVKYNKKKEDKKSAILLHMESFGYLQERSEVTQKDLIKYLEHYSRFNKRVKHKQIHAICTCKGNQVSYEKLMESGLHIMYKLGYEGQPILIFAHHDTQNNHIHIVSSRIKANGKKISDKFEGKRANMALNELLKLDVKTEFNMALNEALRYNISSKAQLTLLLEQKGYKYKYTEKGIDFFKHGNLQGTIGNKEIEKKILADRIGGMRKERQIRALIYKYKNQFSPTVRKERSPVRTSAKSKFSSPLTECLRKKFGLEFHFFVGKGHEKPYGYSIIDHKNKIVYKGSEVMKLSQMEYSGEHQNKISGRNEKGMNTPIPENHIEYNSLTSNPPENLMDLVNMNSIINAMIDASIIDSEVNSKRVKRKKKNKNLNKSINF